jgi:hypothetical protein
VIFLVEALLFEGRGAVVVCRSDCWRRVHPRTLGLRLEH